MSNKKRTVYLFLLVVMSLTLLVFGVTAKDYQQSPVLKDKVDSGELPNLEERLPRNPKVVDLHESVGEYGGTLDRIYTGVNDFWNLNKFGVAFEPLLQIDQSAKSHPNLVTNWEYMEDGSLLKLKLREGVKWSNGDDFTAEDVVYTLKARENENINISPNALSNAVKVDGVKAESDYALTLPLKSKYVFDFSASNGFIHVLASQYLKQFDPRYNEDMKWGDLNEKIPPKKVTEAWEKYPTLTAWDIVEVRPNKKVVAERNPYFWKVDPEGNQLPYLEKIEFNHTASADNIPMLVKAGKVDFQARHLFFADYSFFKQNEEAGGYTTQILSQTALGPTIHLNYGVKDKDFRKLFRSKDFRIALSLATDREEINRVHYKRQAEPWGMSPLKKSAIYPGDEYATKYVEYKPERAKELLDELGLKDTDGDGTREIKGKDISITVDMDQSGAGGPVKLTETIASQWRKVGIEVVPNPVDRSLILTRWRNNNFEAYAWKQDGAILPFLNNFYWSTTADPSILYGNVGNELNKWVATNGESGIEPPPFIKEINDLYLKASSTLDAEERNSIGRKMSKLYAENLYAIPTTTYVDVGVVSNDIANVPETWVRGDSLRGARVIKPWQFYMKEN